MCNPRRVTTTLTRDLAEAWQREVSRTVELRARVAGEARVRQPLEASIGAPALRALQVALANEGSGWVPVEEGFRRDVEGGYVVYLIDEKALEIVAVMEDEIEVRGGASSILTGEVREQISGEGSAISYDDGWGGRTAARAEEESHQIAMQKLDETARRRVLQAQREAEEQQDPALRAKAEEAARAELERATRERELSLARQARQRLEAVGLRCRQAFHGALAQAYRDAFLAYARNHGAQNISCHEEGDTLEIEFHVQR
jgi:FtsH ternary system domain X2